MAIHESTLLTLYRANGRKKGSTFFAAPWSKGRETVKLQASMPDPQDGPESSGEEWELVKELVFQWETDRPTDLDAWLDEHCPTGSVRR